MKTRLSMVILMVAVLTLCFAATQLMAAEKEECKGKEAKITIADVPAAVAATLQAQAQGGTIDEIEKEDEDGVVTYEADITIGADKFEAKVGADGALISMGKADDEKNEGKDEEKEDAD